MGAFLVGAEHFSCGQESLADNRYMQAAPAIDVDRACRQSRNLAAAIANAGVPVWTFPGLPKQPDAVFPNNVFAPVGNRFLVGSMRHPERQREAGRADIRAFFGTLAGREIVEISRSGGVAELTGPLIIDRARNIGCCGITDRVDQRGLAAMHEGFGFDMTFSFPLREGEYHTNVVMSILAGRALVINPDAIADQSAAAALIDAYSPAVVELDEAETEGFAGNCLALTDRHVFISECGADSLRDVNRKKLQDNGFVLVAVNVDEIEKSGGSVRCMIAEVF